MLKYQVNVTELHVDLLTRTTLTQSLRTYEREPYFTKLRLDWLNVIELHVACCSQCCSPQHSHVSDWFVVRHEFDQSFMPLGHAFGKAINEKILLLWKKKMSPPKDWIIALWPSTIPDLLTRTTLTQPSRTLRLFVFYVWQVFDVYAHITCKCINT